MLKSTKELIKVVERKAGENGSWGIAEELLQQGADVTAATKYGSMIDSVIAEEKRLRPVMSWKADNCLRLIQILERDASEKLSAEVLSENGGNIDKMHQLARVNASCYQPNKYGPLGLLGALLRQDNIPVRLDVVQFLIETDPNTKSSLTTIDSQEQTCLSLAKQNKKCSQNITNYIQQQLDAIINQIPLAKPPIHPDKMTMLISRGANIEAVDEKRNTVLSNAVIANNLALVCLLVSAGSNTAHKNSEGLTPLDIAKKATPRNPQLIAFLEKQNTNIELKRLIETNKSHLTVQQVQTLLQNGANINGTFAKNDSPLHLLIRNNGTPDMIAAFVHDFKADILAMNSDGHRPIETCILHDEKPFANLRIFFQLSEVTINLFHNSKLNKTILQFAIEKQRTGAAEIIQDELNVRLWKCMTHSNTKDDNNQTVLKDANLLIKYGAQVNYQHKDKEYLGWTILHLICQIGTKQLVQHAVEYLKADYTLPNHNGDYPMSIAAEYGNLPIVEYLLCLPKSNVNVVNKEKQTPLHLATKNHHLLVVRYLVRRGANHQAQNQFQQTPLDIARTNVSKNKADDMNDKQLIYFLEQLVCPPIHDVVQQSSKVIKPTYDLDTCELATPVVINPIQMSIESFDEPSKHKLQDLLSRTPDSDLHDAAKEGDLWMAKQAIGRGADIRHRKKNRTPYEVVLAFMNEYNLRLNSPMLNLADRQRIQAKATGCHQIADMIQQIAKTKLVEAIDESNSGLVMAYHLAGAPLTADLLSRACQASDNVEIVDYLVKQSPIIYQVLVNDSTSSCPYRIAKAKHFNAVTAYIKYRLSLECIDAIKANNLQKVKKLVLIGASVDMQGTNNLKEALQHQNVELVQFLCENGAKIPLEWVSENGMQLKSDFSTNLKPEVISCMNRFLINKRLRFAAASGDLRSVIQCQRSGADINSMNCHGSTALLCTIQHGNYFSIVHALVSSGASILHSNSNEPASLIDLAKVRNYTQIASYLSQELNKQFLSAVLNNDRDSANKFAQLGADFNYQDEQKRTPLHYAVQYHGVDLVSWLCECGSSPTICDINGDFPIIQATEKGDFAIVEFFVTKYPATKRQTNKAGLTALEIAKKLKFTHIAELIETGKAAPESFKDQDSKDDERKRKKEALFEAARIGPIKTIQEFINERYESREEKSQLCYELIQIAKAQKQLEILHILEAHYKKLKKELRSDIELDNIVNLTKEYQVMLQGLLGGLSSIIVNSPVVLDPADPSTYVDLFSNLAGDVEKTSHDLKHVISEGDVKKLIHQDEANTKQQLAKISEQLEQFQADKDALQARILDTDERLFKQQQLTALQKKELAKEKELFEKQLATYECSILLFQRQQEATLIRQKTINFIKTNTNLIMFYRIIENHLQALFHSALAAQGGYVKTETTIHSGFTGKINNMLSMKIPILSLASPGIKAVFDPVMSKLNEKEQKKEWHNLTTLGNIEELNRIASDTAGLLTLYYREQIQCIDTSNKIKGSNPINNKITPLKQAYNVRPESSEEIAVTIVAEYITEWIIDVLKAGKEKIVTTEPLPQQLWLHVAKSDPINQGKSVKLTDAVGITDGKQRIPLQVTKKLGISIEYVQLRYLIGCASVVCNNGDIYQYRIPKDSTDEELLDLEKFGYVYVTPFSTDNKVWRSIVEGRKLHLANRDPQGNILTKFADIIEYAKTYANQNDQHHSTSLVLQETANQVAQVLHQQKLFLNSNDVKSELKKARENIELSVDVLREELKEKVHFYQTSIDAAHEQIQHESKENREAMKKDNEKHYNEISAKLNEQFKDTQKRLEQLITNFMNDIAKQTQEKTKEILKIAESANAQSMQAISQANQAVETSRTSLQQAKEAANSAQKVVQWEEQRSHEFKLAIKTMETRSKEEATAQNEFYKQTILDMRTKVERDFERAQASVDKSSVMAKESSQIAQEAKSSIQEIQKTTKSQLENQKKETQKTIIEAKEARQQSERAALEAREAEKQAKRAAEASTVALEKLNSLYERVRNALDRIEK